MLSRLPYIFNKHCAHPWICISSRTKKLSGSTPFERKEMYKDQVSHAFDRRFSCQNNVTTLSPQKWQLSLQIHLFSDSPTSLPKYIENYLSIRKIKAQVYDRFNNLSVMIKSAWVSPGDALRLEDMLSLSLLLPNYYLCFFTQKCYSVRDWNLQGSLCYPLDFYVIYSFQCVSGAAYHFKGCQCSDA